MINLLPPEIKSSYRYARSNVALRKWVVICVVSLVGLGAIATFGALSIHEASLTNKKEIAATEAAFKKADFEGTQKRVEEISGSFKLVVKVLGQEILFSKLIKQIGAAIPANANLTGLNINQSQSALAITAEATDYKTATQVQVNLADPKNQIFSKADIENIDCTNKSATGTAGTHYPCTISIKALFMGNNKFLFINDKNTQAAP